VVDLRVALTFDAEHPSRPHCPPDVVGHILATLSKMEVPATFFIQGRWATAYPDTARSIARGGHLIGNHSHYHASFPLLSVDGVREDLAKAEEAIGEATGSDPRPWFRFPFGEGEGAADLALVLASSGYRHVGWHVDPNDWDAVRSAEDVERSVMEESLGRGTDTIVLLHAWPATTAEALPRIIARLQAEGACFVGVDQIPFP
jgi:peptidoglycan/xylan/chitin deacetylase (PgdA/CDA1 family)